MELWWWQTFWNFFLWTLYMTHFRTKYESFWYFFLPIPRCWTTKKCGRGWLKTCAHTADTDNKLLFPHTEQTTKVMSLSPRYRWRRNTWKRNGRPVTQKKKQELANKNVESARWRPWPQDLQKSFARSSSRLKMIFHEDLKMESMIYSPHNGPSSRTQSAVWPHSACMAS